MATDAVPASDLAIASVSGSPAASAERAGPAEAAEPAAPAVARPYAPSWVDRLIVGIEALPGPTALAYLGLMAIAVAASLVEPLLDGQDDSIVLAGQAFWGVFVPLTLWLVHYLSDVAGTAFDTFRPALTASDDEAARIRYGLTVIPAGPALAILALSLLITPLYYLVDAEASGVVGVSPVGMVLRYASEVFFGSIILVLVVQSLRQLRAVGRIHASATRVDLFRPAPLYAFSVLTSRTAMVIAVVFIVPSIVAAGQTGDDTALVFVVPWMAVGIVAAAAVFAVPLRGMQRRIAAEKRRLQGEVGARIEATIEAIHRAVDGGDMAAAATMHDTLGVLVMERDLVDKLPTLPWRAGTAGAVASAIVLPIGLFVVTRLLERVI